MSNTGLSQQSRTLESGGVFRALAHEVVVCNVDARRRLKAELRLRQIIERATLDWHGLTCCRSDASNHEQVNDQECCRTAAHSAHHSSLERVSLQALLVASKISEAAAKCSR